MTRLTYVLIPREFCPHRVFIARRERRLRHYWRVDGFTLQRIAEMEGISSARVRQIVGRFEREQDRVFKSRMLVLSAWIAADQRLDNVGWALWAR